MFALLAPSPPPPNHSPPTTTLQGATLKAMRELLHAGERLGVGVSATAALRSRIRRREWEDSARKALSAKTSVNALAGETGGHFLSYFLCRFS